MKRHQICAIAAALTAATVLGGCSVGSVELDDYLTSLPSVEESRAQRRESLTPVVSDSALKNPGTLVVGIPLTQTVPFSASTEQGEVVGLSVETAHAIADELGIASISLVSVGDVESALKDQCDIVIGVEPDDVESATVLGPYAQSATGVFTRGDVSAPIDASQLTGASVGVQEGSVSAVTLDGYDLDISRVHFTSLNEAFDALEEGSVKYVVCDAYAGAYLAAIYSDVSFAGTLDDPTVVGVSAANPELEDAVGAALETLRTSGLSVVARASWVGDLPDLSTDSRITGLAERVEEQEPADDAEDEGEGTEGEKAEGEEAQTPEDQEGDSQVSDGQDDEAQDGEAQTPEGEEEPVQSDAM